MKFPQVPEEKWRTYIQLWSAALPGEELEQLATYACALLVAHLEDPDADGKRSPIAEELRKSVMLFRARVVDPPN